MPLLNYRAHWAGLHDLAPQGSPEFLCCMIPRIISMVLSGTWWPFRWNVCARVRAPHGILGYLWNLFDVIWVACASLERPVVGFLPRKRRRRGSRRSVTLKDPPDAACHPYPDLFAELYSLIAGPINARKTLMWAGILVLPVLTMWRSLRWST